MLRLELRDSIERIKVTFIDKDDYEDYNPRLLKLFTGPKCRFILLHNEGDKFLSFIRVVSDHKTHDLVIKNEGNPQGILISKDEKVSILSWESTSHLLESLGYIPEFYVSYKPEGKKIKLEGEPLSKGQFINFVKQMPWTENLNA